MVRSFAEWKGGTMKRIAGVALILAVLLAPVSCRTRKPPEEGGLEVQPAEFRPATILSRLHFEKGNYPHLFAPSSYALWVDETVTGLRREAAVTAGESIQPDIEAEAARIAQNYLIIECHMDSVFADMSIAYDVVGYRGLSVYLSTPDGRKIPPIQTLISTSAKEEQREALKLFGRTNLVVFPKRDLWLDRPLVTSLVAPVRLVLEGYNSTFYFEWPATPPTGTVAAPTHSEVKEVLKVGFREFHERVRQLAHIFD